jgi:hypothetical protein
VGDGDVDVGCSLVLWAPVFPAMQGAARTVRAATEPKKIACLIRISGSPCWNERILMDTIVTNFCRDDLCPVVAEPSMN